MSSKHPKHAINVQSPPTGRAQNLNILGSQEDPVSHSGVKLLLKEENLKKPNYTPIL